MTRLPAGTVTFLFTDIEGSTKLLEQSSDRYAQMLGDHRRLLRSVFQRYDGREIDTQGDAFFVAFSRATDALAAALAGQRALQAHSWPAGTVMRVRMGLHTGAPISAETGYVGMDVHRAARICAAGHGGQILISEATRALVEDDLPAGVALRDLGHHRLKDLSRPQHIFQVVASDLPRDHPPLRSLDARPNNLPIQLTSFIGREREIGEIRRLLATTRLLTLTGAGGGGKTRLAVQVAADHLDEFPDGVWWIELAPLTDPDLVPEAVASSLNVSEQPGRPLMDTLLDALRAKLLLLALDNCEHLLSACANFADAILRRCRGVRILATSREGLGMEGEMLYSVRSLSRPDRGAAPSEILTRSEAVRLFADRARAVRPDFEVTDRNAQAVAHVCRRLDGIPLAVELAASRLSALPIEEMAARLDDRFRLLTGGSRTALPRHQTLRAAMDWSYDLLSETEKAALRRLSVFAGGWTVRAAEAVCAGQGVEAADVLDLLTHLVNKSLVVAEEHQGRGRYRFLETVRQYNSDRLVEAGEAESARRRHRELFLTLVEEAEPHLTGSDQVSWLNRLEAEHDNLRAALDGLLGAGDTEGALRMTGSLSRYWSVRGHFSEGRESSERALGGPGGSSAARAKALIGLGNLAYRQDDIGRAKACYAESLTRYRELGDKAGMARSLSGLAGVVRDGEGDYVRARALFEESLALFRELGDAWGAALVLGNMGFGAQYAGDYAEAAALFRESLDLNRRLGNKFGIAFATEHLGGVAAAQGDVDRAKQLLEEGLVLFQELGDEAFEAFARADLGVLNWLQGDYGEARRLLHRSVVVFREAGDRWNVGRSLLRLARIALSEGEPDRAARLCGTAEAVFEAVHSPMWPTDRSDFSRLMADARASLADTAFVSAWGNGRAMTLEQAIAYALEA
jgi:predicted ATPase/class 3 adenylate cyclase